MAVLAPSFPRLLTHEFAPFHGGIATYVEETAAAIGRLGRQVEVIAPDYGGTACDSDGNSLAGVTVRRFPASGRLSWAARWNLVRAFGRERRAWREGFSIWASPGILWAGLAFSRLTGWWPRQPPVALFHGSEILKFQRSRAWRWLAPTLAARSLHFAGAAGGASTLLRAIPWVRDRFVHQLVCACPAWLVEAATHLSPPRLDDGRLNVLTLARLHPRKGHLILAEAFGRLSPALRETVRWIVRGEGEASYVEELRRVAQSLGIAVELGGGVDRNELSQVYAMSDVYALTSRQMPESIEGFGITYLEAAVHAKPSVGFHTGGVAEAVVDGETGLLVPEGDVSALASALEKLLSDSSLRRRLGEAARRHALRFRWEDTAATLLRLGDGGHDPSVSTA